MTPRSRARTPLAAISLLSTAACVTLLANAPPFVRFDHACQLERRVIGRPRGRRRAARGGARVPAAALRVAARRGAGGGGAARRGGRRPAVDGRDRERVQAARLHLPVLGGVRRLRRLLRLRPARRRAAREHQEGVVARHGAPARGRRRPRLVDHRRAGRVAGVRPRRRLLRPDGRLQGVEAPLPRRPALLGARGRRRRDARLRLCARERRDGGGGAGDGEQNEEEGKRATRTAILPAIRRNSAQFADAARASLYRRRSRASSR